MDRNDPIDLVNVPLVSTLRGCRIASLACAVPSEIRTNDAFGERFGEGAQQVTKMTGVMERRISGKSQTTADLCFAAAEHLFAKTKLPRQQINALIFVTQTPDYRLPATACELQDRLGLSKNIAAFDVNLGCSGYTYGLWLAASLMSGGGISKVLLLVGDTISKIAADDDRSTAMLFGDCGTATIVELSDNSDDMNFVLGTDGGGSRNLIVPRGGFRDVSGEDGRNQNPPETLFMEGSEIFNFTLKAVPALVSALRNAALLDAEDFDIYLFHQANAFMIKHLAKKAKIALEKAPINIDRFGNTSSATIPLLIATKCSEAVQGAKGVHAGMFGFGVGYSWAGCATRLRNLDCADLVIAA
jgi:3-oxoacyl-[acyl-carrier-protein] synthase III